MENLKLMCVLAHPNDAALGNGAMLARYASEGVETYLITATRGERSWFGAPKQYPGLDEFGRTREAELRSAAAVLGVREVVFLDLPDGELADVDTADAVEAIGRQIQRIRPDIVVTFDQTGIYGDPDHVAISRLTTTAVVAASQVDFLETEAPATHLVAKLYYMAWTKERIELYESAFGPLQLDVDGDVRELMPWAEWAVTTLIDGSEHWRRAREAIACHRTQIPICEALLTLPESFHRELWSEVGYFRAFSFVNGTGAREDDLFIGIR